MPWINNISEQQAIDAHLSDRQPIQLPDGVRIQVTSGFWACLSDARTGTGRDAEGRIVDGRRSTSWLGNVGYLVLLDQIGSCFKGRTQAVVQGNAIEKALSYFTGLDQAHKRAIYALRCALAHDYSLINKNPNQADLQHHFTLTGGSGRLVVFPTQAWDGDIHNQTQHNQTVVDVVEIGNLVEGIYRELVRLAANNELEIVLSGGKDELLMRYTFAFQV